jgi:N utilization substance protein A
VSKKTNVEDCEPSVVRNEILQVTDVVSRDRGIDKDEILSAMEEAILRTAQMRYGKERDLVAAIDRKTGEICISRRMTIVENVENEAREVALSEHPESQVGDVIEERLPAISFGRIAAQTARHVITQRIRSAERDKQYEEFSGRVGDIITGIVKRIDFPNVILDVGRTEGIIRKFEIIPNEVFRVGDRVKVLLASLNKDQSLPLLQLSRTSPEFLKKLFEQEVPEVYDGAIKIVSVVRDPGSKAKVAVTTSDQTLDPVGACVGVRGSRVRAIIEELKGEKIDIIPWSEDTAMFIVSSLSPAEVVRVVIDEAGGKVDVVVPDEKLSSAIGRKGQNVRLASRLTGWMINVIAESEDSDNRSRESARLLKSFIERLDVDEMIAHLLINEGFTSVEELAATPPSEISSIDGFDDGIANELHQRAVSSVEERKRSLAELCQKLGVEKSLAEYELLSPDLLEIIVNSGIKTLNDLGGLSTDELLGIVGDALSKPEAETLIMNIRSSWN